MPAGPVLISSPALLWTALALAGVALALVVLRRPALPQPTHVLAGVGLLLICLSAGGPVWRRPAAGGVAVFVDLSPSTRSADYRDRAALDRRIKQLVGDIPYRVSYFAQDVRPDAPGGDRMGDLPAERTVYDPPTAASAVLLFSDGRFDPPAGGGPPTYPVLDPGLLSPADAAVEGLGPRGRDVAVRVRNTGPARPLTLAGVGGPPATTAPAGAFVVTRPVDPGAAGVAATLGPGDLWPENDSLAAPPPPAARVERWVVGGLAPAADWKAMTPADLPIEPAAYLAPAVIVLADVAADALTPLQQDRLRQYVHDLGGGLVLLGGGHAFAAGGYPGTVLDALSPLASHPPQPTTHWLLLADGSGSMSAPAAAGGDTRWRYATDAISRVLPRLPPDDVASVGDFAERVTWWSAGRTVRETLALPLPPANARPHGPTNLRAALDAIAAAAKPALPKQLLLLTDADAEVGDPAPLAAALKAKQIRLNLLAIGDGSAELTGAGRGLSALRQVVDATGGLMVSPADAAGWAGALLDLSRTAGPRLLEDSPLPVRFTGELGTLSPRAVPVWNRTWLKPAVAALADADAGGDTLRPVARWNAGEGAVLAAGFAANAAETEAFAAAVARPPADPRFRISWETDARLCASVDAAGPADYLNGLDVAAEFTPQGSATGNLQRVPQTGPGRYELSLPAARAAGFAAVRVGGRVLDRIAVAGRYPPEFDAIGTDREALRALADATGGRVVDPLTTNPVEFRRPTRDVSLAPWLAAAGAAFVAAGLVWWRARESDGGRVSGKKCDSLWYVPTPVEPRSNRQSVGGAFEA